MARIEIAELSTPVDLNPAEIRKLKGGAGGAGAGKVSYSDLLFTTRPAADSPAPVDSFSLNFTKIKHD